MIKARSLLGVIALSYPMTSMPFGSAAESPLMYYEMGGGEPIREPMNVLTLPLVSVDAQFTLPNACDLWDFKHLDDVADRFETMVKDHIEGTMDQLGQQILINVTAHAQGLLAASIQRAMPGMYDYAQNVHGQLTTEIEVAKGSCERTLAKVEQGNNPLSVWKEASSAEAWKDALGLSFNANGGYTAGGSANILRAEQSIRTNEGATSVPWFGGDKGGEGDDPINVVEDTIKAGYALQAGSTNTDQVVSDTRTVAYNNPESGASTRGSRLGQLWPSSTDAVTWAQKVVGERVVSFCTTCTSQQQGGTGLLAAFYDERMELETGWQTIFDSTAPPTIAQMANVSGGSVHLTMHVYEALEAMVPQDRSVYVDRLIADAAVSRTAEKAMAIRRLLRTAESTPEVAAYPHVQEEMKAVQDDLKAELDELKWELDLQKNLTSDTAASLVSYHNAQRSRALFVPTGLSNQYNGPGTIGLEGDKPVLRD